MNRFVLDTSFLLNLIRNTPASQTLVTQLGINDPGSLIILSVVSVAEIRVLARRRNWGNPKLQKMEQVIAAAMVIDINLNDDELLARYVDIDTNSQALGRRMGKNDLWIAATTMVANATLVTGDGDFDHLNGSIQIVKIPVN
jgi:predicted nucleic acid-binding protein